MSAKLLPLAGAGVALYYFEPLRTHLNTLTHTPTLSGWLLASALATLAFSAFAGELLVAVQFAYNCFLRPLGAHSDQKGRLDSFYERQASIYDKTRSKLLRGRTTMLRLSAAHLHEQRRKTPEKPLVWVDIGGGTGWNVEEMDKYFNIKDFDAVYVLDLCGPLLEVSKARFQARGWTNVHCLLQDATSFTLPTWSDNGIEDGAGLDFVTMSYSLSMMPDYLTLLDRVERFLNPTGLFAVADFYVSSREPSSIAGVIGDITSRQCSYWTRFFWLHWFAFDHVDLHVARRQYVEHRFATIKSFNGRNSFIFPQWVIGIPYYVSLHTSRNIDTSKAQQFYERDAGNTISASPSPMLFPTKVHTTQDSIPDLALGVSAALSSTRSSTSNKPVRRSNSRSSDRSDSFRIPIEPETQLSSFHFGQVHRRVPYIDDPIHREFRTWIYSFTWEDPAVDMKSIKLGSDDDVLCITSGGENAMHYAIEGRPHRIHTVDMNDKQGHLLELKLAAISALEYDDIWKLFGEGKHPNFRALLDNKLSPYLSSHAYSFWRQNDRAFADSFYLRGYSGHALRIAGWALWLAGVTKSAHAMCAAPTLDKQREIWQKKIRPVLLSGFMTKVVFSNPMFLWNALGVPINQLKCFLRDTSVAQFAVDTLDPVALNTHIASDNYFYQLCLEKRYTPASCPLWLKPASIAALKKDNSAALDCFRLHTDSIVNVLNRLSRDGPTLSVAVIMDLSDWFRDTVSAPPVPDDKPCELTTTLSALHKALKKGGRVFFRSAGLSPWYLELYKRLGFEVECLQKREIGSKIPIDRVQMYASFYQATKK